ncbi:TPA: hypothetical protein ACS5XR_005004 [Salmonella enterica]
MSELAGLHPQISELSEYEQYLLSALLKRAVAAEFFDSRQADRKTQPGYRRSATLSRKMRDIRAQEKSDFHWKPIQPRR